MSAPKIAVKLTASNMGDVTEADFDLWAAWVASHIDEACSVDAEVEQMRFGEAAESDIVTGRDDAAVERVQDWLSYDAWEQWCAAGVELGEVSQ